MSKGIFAAALKKQANDCLMATFAIRRAKAATKNDIGGVHCCDRREKIMAKSAAVMTDANGGR